MQVDLHSLWTGTGSPPWSPVGMQALRDQGLYDALFWLVDFAHKEYILEQLYGKNLAARDFYAELFDDGIDLQQRDGHADGKANVIAISKNKVEGRPWHRYTIHPDDHFEDIDRIPADEFAFISPLTYYGKKRVLKNARFMYALTFDLDGVTAETLEKGLLVQIREDILPTPTYIVNSGHGLHLYYKFSTPIPMFPAMQQKMKAVKDELLKRIWNRYTSEDEKIQYQSINQGFRVVGGKTKATILRDEKSKDQFAQLETFSEVKAYRTGKEITLKYLSDYIYTLDDIDIDKIEKYRSNLSLEEAKEKYPDWYERRIEKGLPVNQWAYNRAVYDYWKKKVYEEATYGHRYWCIYTLAAFALKCGKYDEKKNPDPVTYDELKKDAKELQKYLTKLSAEPFTKSDMRDALKVYDDEELAMRLTKKYLEMETAISMPPKIRRKENPQRQEWHLEDARDRKRRMKERGQAFKAPEGRPSAKLKIEEFLSNHPDAGIREIVEGTGVCRQTAAKWLKNIHSEK